MTSNKKEHPLQTFAKLVHDHRKGIIGTLAVVFAAFLLSVGTVYVSDSGLQGSFARSRASRAGLTEAKPAKSLSYVSCRDTDMENDPTVGGTVTIVGVVGPDRQYLSQKDTCRENVNTEYECNTVIFPKAGGKVKKTDIPEGVSFWAEAGSAACGSGCGGDDRCLREEEVPDEEPTEKLTVSFLGPEAQKVAAGSRDVEFFRFSLAAQEDALEIRNLNFALSGDVDDAPAHTTPDRATDGQLVGSSATGYFYDIKFVDVESGRVVGGPFDLNDASTVLHGVSPLSSTTSVHNTSRTAFFAFRPALNIPSHTTKTYKITADIQQFEDSHTDIFHGASYEFALQAWEHMDVRIVTADDDPRLRHAVNPTDIVPPGAIAGRHVKVVAPEE